MEGEGEGGHTICRANRSIRSSGALEYVELEVETDEKEYDLTPFCWFEVGRAAMVVNGLIVGRDILYDYY